jgi:hypothetical protein
MYLMVNGSKGVSSVFLGKRLGVTQCTAWKRGRAIRRLMELRPESKPQVQSLFDDQDPKSKILQKEIEAFD